MLGPWLRLLRMNPHTVKAFFFHLVQWGLTFAIFGFVLTYRTYTTWALYRSEGFSVLELFLYMVVTFWELYRQEVSHLASAVSSWSGAAVEFVVMKLVKAFESPLARCVWQLLAPLFGLVTACTSRLSEIMWQVLQLVVTSARHRLWSFARTLLPSRTRSREAWDNDMAQVLSNSMGQNAKGKQKAKQQPKGGAAANSKQQRHKPKPQSQIPASSHSDESVTAASAPAAGNRNTSPVTSHAHIHRPDTAAAVPNVHQQTANVVKSAADPCPHMPEAASKQSTAKHNPADKSNRRRKQQRVKAVAKPTGKALMPEQAAKQQEEAASGVHSVLLRASVTASAAAMDHAATDAVLVKQPPIPEQKTQAVPMTQLHKPLPQLQDSGADGPLMSASTESVSTFGPTADPSKTPDAMPSDPQSMPSLPPSFNARACDQASDPLTLLGQPTFSPGGSHANQPITQPAAAAASITTTTTDSDASQTGMLHANSKIVKAGKQTPATVYSPASVPVLPPPTTCEGSGKQDRGGAEADMGDDCIVCWAAKRSTLLAPCGHKVLCR